MSSPKSTYLVDIMINFYVDMPTQMVEYAAYEVKILYRT